MPEKVCATCQHRQDHWSAASWRDDIGYCDRLTIYPDADDRDGRTILVYCEDLGQMCGKWEPRKETQHAA